MHFRQFLHEQRSCASYIVGCQSLGVCTIIDPQGDPGFYLTHAEGAGMSVVSVIETHLHADHRSCARELGQRAGIPHYLGPNAEVGYSHESLSNGQVLEVGNRQIRVLHTPGHTPEHVSLLVDDWFVLTGDTLFVGDVGRVDLALSMIDKATVQSRAAQLRESLGRLLSLPDWVEVYPGHFAGSVCGRGMDGKPSSTIGRERRFNRLLLLPVQEFLEHQVNNLPPLPLDFESIKRFNMGIREKTPLPISR